MQYKNIDFLFSTDCNMACQYCYIKKDKKEMVSYNQKTREKILNGELRQNVINSLGEIHLKEVQGMGLWGAEPTMNAKYFESFLDQMLEIMPNLNYLMFSTNSYLGYDYVKLFIEAIDELSKKYNKKNFSLHIQFSLDGPAWINEQSRKTGATQRTIDTMYAICDNFTDDFNGRVEINIKPTLAFDYMKKMLDEPKLLKEYFNFFEDLENTIAEKSKGKEKLDAHPHGWPTLVLPGEYTSEDGKNYARWIKLLWDSKIDKKFSHNQPFRIINTMSRSIDTWELNERVTCGAGASSIVLNADGAIISCHQLGKYSSYPTEKCQVPIVQSHSTLTGESINKVEYTMNLLHAYDRNLFSYFEIMAIELAKAGQIESIYLTNQEARKLLYLFVTCAFCFAGQGEETQEPFIFSPSLIRFFGNGAAEMLFLYGQDQNLIRYKLEKKEK